MSSAGLSVPNPQSKSLEDPLAYLRCSTVLEFNKGEAIYSEDRPSNSIYLIISGKVKVCRIAEGGQQVIVDIYQPDEFFGESAFLGSADRSEVAVAMEATEVMTWTVAEIEDISMKRPKLAMGFMQLLIQRSEDFSRRIESLSVDNVVRRLAHTLIRFSERLGSRSEDGSIKMIPFTHELLSQYVGTSREIITHYMNVFRRQGYLSYSRKGILVDINAMKGWLRENT